MTLQRCLLLAACLTLAACQFKPKLPGLIEYSCREGKKFYVDYGPGFDAKKPLPSKTTVHYDETAIVLPQVPTASGARYSDEMTTFWSKGREATLKTSQGKYEGCLASE